MKGFTQHAIDKYHKILRELPARTEQRTAAVDQRLAMLRAVQAQNLRMEADRVSESLSRLPAGLQRAAALDRVGELRRKVHRLARKGVP